MIDAKALRLVTQNGQQAFAIGHILDGIAALRTLLPYCSLDSIISVEADSLEENYHHMLSFLREGGNDEKRSDVQEKIKRKGIALLEHACRTIRLTKDNDRYSTAANRLDEKEHVLEAFKSSPLKGDLEGIHQDNLFDLLWTSPLWTQQDTVFWYDFLLRQQDMVQQHLAGGVFLAAWEHFDAEKICLLGLLADSECRRTRLSAVCYLLLLRLRHAEIASLMPPLPDSLRHGEGRQLVSQVQYELLLMLVSEKDMEQELKDAEALSREMLTPGKTFSIKDVKGLISLKGRYLRNRLQRGLDINLAKIPLLHSSAYMKRISHWFLPFDKNHPLFQSVLIDDEGNEKHQLSALLDLILDCDVDKLATLYLAASDQDFSKAVRQLDEQQLPDMEDAVVPEYSLRFIMQDLYRFFLHSPLSSQLTNPFRQKLTLFDFQDLFSLIPAEDVVKECELLFELGRYDKVVEALDAIIGDKGASASALLLKGKALRQQKSLGEAISQARSAEMLEPDNADILRFLVECYALQNRFDEELEYLQRLAELLPEDRDVRRLIPVTMARAGRKEEALQLFFKLDYEASEDDDDYETILSCIADTALELGKLDIAGRYTEKERELLDGKAWKSWLRSGHIKLLEGDLKGSIGNYEEFVRTYKEQHAAEVMTALSAFDRSKPMLLAKGIKEEDILLIRDVLQANIEGKLF